MEDESCSIKDGTAWCTTFVLISTYCAQMSCDMSHTIMRNTSQWFMVQPRELPDIITANICWDQFRWIIQKKKMINELVYRWHGFKKQHDLAKTPPENSEDDECPICYDTMKSCKWSYPTSSWEINRDDVITTECNHTYCTRCWNEHLEKSSRWTHYSTRRYVSCPMCRHVIPADP